MVRQKEIRSKLFIKSTPDSLSLGSKCVWRVFGFALSSSFFLSWQAGSFKAFFWLGYARKNAAVFSIQSYQTDIFDAVRNFPCCGCQKNTKTPKTPDLRWKKRIWLLANSLCSLCYFFVDFSLKVIKWTPTFTNICWRFFFSIHAPLTFTRNNHIQTSNSTNNARTQTKEATSGNNKRNLVLFHLHFHLFLYLFFSYHFEKFDCKYQSLYLLFSNDRRIRGSHLCLVVYLGDKTTPPNGFCAATKENIFHDNVWIIRLVSVPSHDSAWSRRWLCWERTLLDRGRLSPSTVFRWPETRFSRYFFWPLKLFSRFFLPPLLKCWPFPLLDGFQVLQAVWNVERFLSKLIRAKCNFHIVFFNGMFKG